MADKKWHRPDPDQIADPKSTEPFNEPISRIGNRDKRDKAVLEALKDADVPLRDRKTFEARIVYQEQYKEIAHAFGCDVRSVKRSISRSFEACERWSRWKKICQQIRQVRGKKDADDPD